MSKIECSRTINAPMSKVFTMIADPEKFAARVPHITNIEFLTDQRSGKGTIFKETRIMKKRESSTTLEITEYEPNENVRFVTDEGGTIWDTIFTLSEHGSGTELNMVMDCRPHKLMAKIVTPMIKGMIGKAIESDMDATKAYLEKSS